MALKFLSLLKNPLDEAALLVEGEVAGAWLLRVLFGGITGVILAARARRSGCRHRRPCRRSRPAAWPERARPRCGCFPPGQLRDRANAPLYGSRLNSSLVGFTACYCTHTP